MPALPTPEEALKALKAQPGIDLTRQRKGTKIMVETDNHLFEITVLNPASGLVEVSSTLPLLRESTVASTYEASMPWMPTSAWTPGSAERFRCSYASATATLCPLLSLRPVSWPRLDLRRVLVQVSDAGT